MSTSKLEQADQLKARLHRLRPLPSDVVAELRQRYMVKFTYNSNAIEGNTLTQSETEMVLERGITVGGKTLVEHLEVIGHRDAIALIEELTQSKTLVRVYEIRQIHALIMGAISREEAGQYRRILVQSAGTGYVYPAPGLLEGLMAEFVDWLTAPSTLHPLEFATEAHLRFVSIHPFRDGNGCTGRLLMNLLLMQTGFPIVVIPNARRLDYINAIVAYQQQQMGVAPLLDLVIDGAIESLNQTLEVVESFY
ncbi:MAG: Fic family protein [Leptolyngbyaceae cyanobacterium bins.302]|nr:Fic family protein [Leptolyngbyaceae cyanobacterium bins.302]